MEILRTLFSTTHGIFLLITGIIGLSLLVLIHECGHFIMCKIFGVRTPSFSIGMGPKLVTKKIGETEFSISAIPMGGYVEIAGNQEIGQGDQKAAKARDAGSFATKAFYKKFLIMIGGILFNMIFAYSVLIIIFTIGLPKSEIFYPFNGTSTIEIIEKDSSAEKVGLLAGDHLVSFDNVPLNNSSQQFLKTVNEKNGAPVSITYERNNIQQIVEITPTQKTFLGKKVWDTGIKFTTTTTQGLPIVEAIKKGIYLTNKYIILTINAFKYIFASRDTSNVGGPLMIIKATSEGASQGFSVFFFFLAILSINLAILNLIPLPIFDGGQIVIYGIEALIGRDLPEAVRNGIALISWGLILLLLVWFSIKDIIRIGFKWLK